MGRRVYGQQVYGDAPQWPRIFEANRDQIRNADLIFPGQVLRIAQ
jgi:nucleoid-associated protein YgaU